MTTPLDKRHETPRVSALLGALERDDLSWDQAGPKFQILAEQLERELAEAQGKADTYLARLNPSIEYVEGTPVGYGEDEIDRLHAQLSASSAEATNESMRLALLEILNADLALAQLFNRLGKEDGATIAEWNDVRQAADQARTKARAALKGAASNAVQQNGVCPTCGTTDGYVPYTPSHAAPTTEGPGPQAGSEGAAPSPSARSSKKPTRLRIETGRLLSPDGTEDICDQQYVAAQDALELEAQLDAVSATQQAFEDTPLAWAIYDNNGERKELVFSPLTDETYMDEGYEAWPLHRKLNPPERTTE